MLSASLSEGLDDTSVGVLLSALNLDTGVAEEIRETDEKIITARLYELYPDYGCREIVLTSFRAFWVHQRG